MANEPMRGDCVPQGLSAADLALVTQAIDARIKGSNGTVRTSAATSRVSAEQFVDSGAQFVDFKRDYTQQYCAMHIVRLSKLRAAALDAIVRKLRGKPVADVFHGVHGTSPIKVPPEKHMADINVETVNSLAKMTTYSPRAAAVTLSKHMALRPSVLTKYMDESLGTERKLTSFVSPEDSVFIEDESSRFRARGPGAPVCNDIVSGAVIGIYGVVAKDGSMIILDSAYPGALHPLEWPMKKTQRSLVAFVSDLQIGAPDEKIITRLNCLVRLFQGLMNDGKLDNLVEKTSHLVIAGDALAQTRQDPKLIRDCDTYLTQLASCLSVLLMPGPNDPSGMALPQGPLNVNFFPLCRRYKSFSALSNPAAFEIDQIRISGSSGQPITDITSYTTLDEKQALKLCADLRCLAPTAPDTLVCYPASTHDPFLIDNSAYPAVIFSRVTGDPFVVSNQSGIEFEQFPIKSETRQESETSSPWTPRVIDPSRLPLLVGIPSFAETGVIMFIDLDDFSSHLVAICGQ